MTEPNATGSETESKVQIVKPTRADLQALGIQAELEQDAARPMAPDLSYYRQTLGPSVGPVVFMLNEERNRKIAECLKVRDLRVFMKDFFTSIRARAREMGYRYEDVTVDGGITRSGRIQIRVTPKEGAEKIV